MTPDRREMFKYLMRRAEIIMRRVESRPGKTFTGVWVEPNGTQHKLEFGFDKPAENRPTPGFKGRCYDWS